MRRRESLLQIGGRVIESCDGRQGAQRHDTIAIQSHAELVSKSDFLSFVHGRGIGARAFRLLCEKVGVPNSTRLLSSPLAKRPRNFFREIETHALCPRQKGPVSLVAPFAQFNDQSQAGHI